MKTDSEHSGVNIPKNWHREFNHDSEKENLTIGIGGCGGGFADSRSTLFRICSRCSVSGNHSTNNSKDSTTATGCERNCK